MHRQILRLNLMDCTCTLGPEKEIDMRYENTESLKAPARVNKGQVFLALLSWAIAFAMQLQGYVITLMVLIVPVELTSSEICEVRKQVELPGESSVWVPGNDGSLMVRGFKYPRETFWQRINEDNSTTTIVCPCMVQMCVQHCLSRL